MNHFVNKLSKGIGQAITRRPWFCLFASILLCVLCATGAQKLTFSNDYRAFFSAENPELIAFENFQRKYTKNDNILIVIHDEDSVTLTKQHALVIEELTEKAWHIPYASRVDSVTNFQYSYAIQDELIIADLIRNVDTISSQFLAEKVQIALKEPLLADWLISDNGRTTGINVTLQYPGESLEEVPEAVNYVRDMIAEMQRNNPNLQFALSGISMLNNAFSETAQLDAQTLTPIMYLVLIVVMYLSIRSIPGTIAAVSVVLFTSVAAMGLTGYIGIELTPISITAPTIILTLAIADSIHVLLSYSAARRENLDKFAAIQESIRLNFIPVSITSFTTIVGFLTLNMSDAPPFKDLGNITAIGICAAWFLSLVLLPSILAILPDRKVYVKKPSKLSTYLGEFGRNVATNYRTVIIVTASICIASAVVIPSIDLNDEFVNYFDERVEFRRDTDFAMEHLTGIYVVELDVKSGVRNGINDPEYLSLLDGFTHWLRNQPEVIHVYSYTDILKRLNKNMHQDSTAWYRLPENANLAAQYLLLYEMSLPYGLDLNDRISHDKSSTRVSLTLDNLATGEIQDFTQRAEAWLSDNTPSTMNAKATGATVMFSHIFQRNAESMLSGNAIAILVICAIMVFTLRSVKYGTLSLIPNTVPLLLTFGIWAILVGRVGVAAATVTSTALGIIVDNTVHLLSKYLRAIRDRGLTPAEAIQYAFSTVGEAIFVTTIILAGGFLVLAYSTFMINAQMGLLTALAIVLALVIDFTLLPALLMLVARKQPNAPATSSESTSQQFVEEPISPEPELAGNTASFIKETGREATHS